MSNLVEHAKKELELIDDGSEMQKMMNNNLIELVEVFSKQGHSGFSGSYAIGTLERLLNFQPLKPLTGEDSEWIEHEDDMYQNNRCSEVFKQGKDGRPYWIRAKVFSDDEGETWFTSGDSHEYIDFPFEPKEPQKVIIK